MPRVPFVLTPERILFTRQAMAMTQEEFGAYLGVEANTVYRWEAGIHTPVGRRAKEIRRRYHAAKRYERRANAVHGTILPADDATDALYPIEGEEDEGRRD